MPHDPDQAIAHVVRLEPAGQTFVIEPGQTIIEAALLAGIDMARSCRNGTCRTCLCRLSSGHIHYRIEWPGLSFDEQDEGYILPCVAHADSDLVIQSG
jgi:ferredoxin